MNNSYNNILNNIIEEIEESELAIQKNTIFSKIMQRRSGRVVVAKLFNKSGLRKFHKTIVKGLGLKIEKIYHYNKVGFKALKLYKLNDKISYVLKFDFFDLPDDATNKDVAILRKEVFQDKYILFKYYNIEDKLIKTEVYPNNSVL